MVVPRAFKKGALSSYVRPAAARAVLARERAWRSDALRETNPGALDDGALDRSSRRGAGP